MPTSCEADIARPADEVFAYVTDPSRFGEWQQNVISGRMAQADHGVGARCVMTRKIGFAERESTSEVTRSDPPRRWSVHGVDGPIRATVDVTVDALDEHRSRVSITVDFEGHGIGRLLVPIVKRQARREMPVNVQSLAKRLQAADTST